MVTCAICTNSNHFCDSTFWWQQSSSLIQPQHCLNYENSTLKIQAVEFATALKIKTATKQFLLLTVLMMLPLTIKTGLVTG